MDSKSLETSGKLEKLSIGLESGGKGRGNGKARGKQGKMGRTDRPTGGWAILSFLQLLIYQLLN